MIQAQEHHTDTERLKGSSERKRQKVRLIEDGRSVKSLSNAQINK